MPDRFNAVFWDQLDQLVGRSQVIVDRAQDNVHPNYADMLYPLDYGYLAGTSGADGGGIDVWVGASGNKHVVGVVVTVDLIKRDTEIKVLLGCTTDEVRQIVQFLHDAGLGPLYIARP